MRFFRKYNSDKSRFLIVCAARTGSTMLRLMLNSHPNICCHGEVFNSFCIRGFVGLNRKDEAPIYHLLHKIRNDNPVEFLNKYVFYPGTFQVIGAKVLYRTLEESMWKDMFTKILADHNILIVHLTRENKLKRFVSDYIASKITHVNLAFRQNSIPPPVRITVSAEECIDDINATEEAENKFRKYFRKHQVFEITYEKMIDRMNNKLVELQQFLGVKPAELNRETLKLNSDKLEDIIENYNELQEIFSGTRFERYLI